MVEADNTTVPEQDHDGLGIKTGWLWVYIGDGNKRVIVYVYTPDRGGTGPARVFKRYECYLHADAYTGFVDLLLGSKIVEVGCWMHARRKFCDARTSDLVRSHLILALVVGFYEVEDYANKARKKYSLWEAIWHVYRDELLLRRLRPILGTILN